MKRKTEYRSTFFTSTLLCILGGILYALGLNIFVIPMGLYSGSLTGVAQILQDFLKNLGVPILSRNTDYTGIFLMLFNIPLILISYRHLRKNFFIKTVLTIIIMTLAFAWIPVPGRNILDDTISGCIVGGIITGVGAGLSLRAQGSAGGMDILGVYLSTKSKNFSVGKLSQMIGVAVIALTALNHDIRTAIYSLIYTVVYSIAVDRVHDQNIFINVQVITKEESAGMELNQVIRRGITKWVGEGVYSGSPMFIYHLIISKDEIADVTDTMRRVDPTAFIVFNEGGYAISGNFEKRLT